MTDDPILRFMEWLKTAKQCVTIPEPTAMTLATVDKSGQPSARVVLLKEVSTRGFVFYTNAESLKGQQIRSNPKVALCFYWGPLNRQVRVQGEVAEVSVAESDAYFASRHRESQIGAWASAQSRELASRDALMLEVAKFGAKYSGKDVPRPPYWTGWRVVPDSIEFWEQGDFRLHDRELFTRTPQGWSIKRLYP